MAEPERHTPPSGKGWALWLLLAVALLVRGGALVPLRSSLADDPDSYRQLATNLATYGTYGYGSQPTAYRPPLWPLILVPCVAGGGAVEGRIAILQLALGLASVVGVWHLTRLWCLPRGAWVATLLVAVDPILVRQSTLVMTETLATFLATASLLALTWYSRGPSLTRIAVSGVCVSLACLTRPTFLPWLVSLPILLLLISPRATAEALRHGICLLIAGGAVLAPWVLRNHQVFDRWMVSTTHGGYTLLLGNNRSFYEYARLDNWGRPWDATEFHADMKRRFPPVTSHVEELHRDELLRDEAWRNITSSPSDFLRSAVLRLGYLFSPLPHRIGTSQSAAQSWIRAAIAVFYLAEFALVLAGIACLRTRLLRAPWIWGVALVASFAAVHLLYWTDMRMRAPLVPVLALVAAAGWGSLAGQRSRA